ncbi:MAG: hypothetical protein ACXWFH_12930 [Solirubrobacterales bacterium]
MEVLYQLSYPGARAHCSAAARKRHSLTTHLRSSPGTDPFRAGHHLCAGARQGDLVPRGYHPRKQGDVGELSAMDWLAGLGAHV